MGHESRKTTDHNEIRRWVEEREGWPAAVKGTGERSDEPGVLRIGFTQGQGGTLEKIDWDTFFDKFDKQHLAFLYQDRTQKGDISRFFKFVKRH